MALLVQLLRGHPSCPVVLLVQVLPARLVDLDSLVDQLAQTALVRQLAPEKKNNVTMKTCHFRLCVHSQKHHFRGSTSSFEPSCLDHQLLP